jgi:hypothetical protein
MAGRRIRPFRLGLWLGVLAATAWFVQRLLHSRPQPSPASPARPTPAPTPPAPVLPIVRPEVVEVGDVEAPGEPEVGTVDLREEAPAPVKKAARKKAAAKKQAAAPVAWVSPDPDGTCPTSHPVKAKLSSKLFHLPGMFAYARTKPDRCYRDAAAAEADGLTQAKR